MQTKNRAPRASSPLNAVTSEQIDAYRKLYLDDHKAWEKLQMEQGKMEQGKKPAKKKHTEKHTAPKHALLTSDEIILALARAVGDHRVKKAGIIETQRRY
ncbi:MAG: hypothetical protein LBB76_09910 [Azoarcus sp.]|nr:hypothetical protein [Azoarcus sp.]